ncbi:MAG: hypothetical protein K0S04_3514, partial [Herbinix sp.]|nr:hypothetical protein [Herbinix sp.]
LDLPLTCCDYQVPGYHERLDLRYMNTYADIYPKAFDACIIIFNNKSSFITNHLLQIIYYKSFNYKSLLQII